MKKYTNKALVIGQALNQTINVFWSVIGFGPISYFCFYYMFNSWFFVFLAFSLIGMFIPVKILNKLRMGNSAAFYEKAGLRFVQNFTQDGAWVNRFLRKRYPQLISSQNKKTWKSHLGKGYVNERFHLMLMIFFLSASIYTLMLEMWAWFLILTVTNVIFNVLPVMLQQYNRLRLEKIARRFNVSLKN